MPIAVAPDYIDLQAVYGHRCRVECEDGSRDADPWRQVVVCRYGHVYPHAAEILGVSTASRGPLVKKLAALPGTQLVADGDDGVNFIFPAGEGEAVFEIVKPRRRRVLSPEHRAKAAEAGRAALAKYRNSQNARSERQREVA